MIGRPQKWQPDLDGRFHLRGCPRSGVHFYGGLAGFRSETGVGTGPGRALRIPRRVRHTGAARTVLSPGCVGPARRGVRLMLEGGASMPALTTRLAPAGNEWAWVTDGTRMNGSKSELLAIDAVTGSYQGGGQCDAFGGEWSDGACVAGALFDGRRVRAAGLQFGAVG